MINQLGSSVIPPSSPQKFGTPTHPRESSLGTPTEETLWRRSREDEQKSIVASDSLLPHLLSPDLWSNSNSTGNRFGQWNRENKSTDRNNGDSVIDSPSVDFNPIMSQSESVEASQYTQMMATLHLLTESSDHKGETNPQFSTFNDTSWDNEEASKTPEKKSIQETSIRMSQINKSDGMKLNCYLDPYEFTDNIEKSPLNNLSQTSPPVLTSLNNLTSPPSLWQTLSNIESSPMSSMPPCFENTTMIYPSFPYFNASSNHQMEGSTPIAKKYLIQSNYVANNQIPNAVVYDVEPRNSYFKNVSDVLDRVDHNIRCPSFIQREPYKNTSVEQVGYQSNTPVWQSERELIGGPRLKLKLTRRNGRTDSGDSGGPTYWGMWEDERGRMIYVSWLPRCARANDRKEKKKCELVLKDFIQFFLGFHGLEKVLLFPPTSAHCKLLFMSETAARSFLNVFGGLESDPGPTLWKIVICRHFQVDIRDGIYSTRVRIIWADQTKNDAEGLTDRHFNSGHAVVQQ